MKRLVTARIDLRGNLTSATAGWIGSIAVAAGLLPVISLRLTVSLVVALGFLVLYFVPPRLLLPITLLLIVVPLDYGILQEFSRIFPLSLIPLSFYIWIRRRAIRWRGSHVRILLAVTLTFGLISGVLGVRPLTSLLFLVLVFVGVAIPLMSSTTENEDIRCTVKFAAFIGIALGGFAIIEYFSTVNPFYFWYEAGSTPLVQHWSTYRIFTSIGHPLVNGSVFSVLLTIGIWQYLSRTYITGKTAGLLIIMSSAAVGLSGSRSAYIASGVGVVVAAYSSRLPGKGIRAIAMKVVLPAIFLGLYLVAGDAREASNEASSSTEVRVRALSAFGQLLEGREVLGTGPGTAEIQNRLRSVQRDVPLESSAVELLVSSGWLGTTLIALLIVSAGKSMFTRDVLPGYSPIIALIPSVLLYNAFEQQTKVVVLAGVLLLIGGREEDAKSSCRGM